jgi:hypothetical protein
VAKTYSFPISVDEPHLEFEVLIDAFLNRQGDIVISHVALASAVDSNTQSDITKAVKASEQLTASLEEAVRCRLQDDEPDQEEDRREDRDPTDFLLGRNLDG